MRSKSNANPHPQDKERDVSFKIAFDTAAMIQARANSIKEEIEKTKTNMLLGSEFVAQGRSRQAEQSKYQSLREVAKRRSSYMVDQ